MPWLTDRHMRARGRSLVLLAPRGSGVAIVKPRSAHGALPRDWNVLT